MERPAKVLVVDDGQDSHDMVELLFSVPGEPGPRPVIFHAWNGQEGLEILAEHQDVDVMLLDLQMPVMDGFEVLGRLGTDRRFQGIPVFVFSGNRDDATRALRLGARDFVNKPGDLLEVKLRLSNLVDGKRRADAAERLKIDLLSVVSHELRSPMNGVLGMAQAIRDTGLTDEQTVYLDALFQSSTKMVSLINNLIGYLESENPVHGLPVEAFSLRKVIQAAFDKSTVEAGQQAVRCHFSLASGVPDGLVGLPSKLQIILEHLINNAVKFSPGGQVSVDVTCAGTSATGAVELTFQVSDTGVGFPMDLRDRLFEPFRQLDGSATRRFGGLGIGLAVASRLVSLLGGVLDVESHPGQGTCLRFTLAFQRPRLPD